MRAWAIVRWTCGSRLSISLSGCSSPMRPSRSVTSIAWPAVPDQTLDDGRDLIGSDSPGRSHRTTHARAPRPPTTEFVFAVTPRPVPSRPDWPGESVDQIGTTRLARRRRQVAIPRSLPAAVPERLGTARWTQVAAETALVRVRPATLLWLPLVLRCETLGSSPGATTRTLVAASGSSEEPRRITVASRRRAGWNAESRPGTRVRRWRRHRQVHSGPFQDSPR